MPRNTSLLLLVMAASVTLGGCSGAGTPPGELRGGSVHEMAQRTLTSLSLVTDWIKMIYMSDGECVESHCETVVVGGVEVSVFYGTFTSGAHEVQWDYPDHSWTRRIVYPGDQILEGTAGPLEGGYPVYTQSGEWKYPDGQRRTWHRRVDYGAPIVTTTTTGEAFTNNDLPMSYVWEQAPGHFDRIALGLPDHSTLTLRSALKLDGPSFRNGITGTLKMDGQSQLSFHMFGARDRFDTLTITDGQNSGSFALDADMSGTGRLQSGTDVAAELCWTDTIEGALDVVGVGRTQVWPTAAARNYQMHNWIGSAAELGPWPLY